MLTITLGPLTMALNHLLLLAALGIASLVGWRVARRGGENPESALFNLFLLGLLFARLGFVLAYWPMYRDDLLQIIDIRDGGFLLWGGLLGIVLGTLWQAGAARACAARWAGRCSAAPCSGDSPAWPAISTAKAPSCPT